MKNRHKGRRGTTLAELLIATVFTAAAAASILGATTFAGKRSQISQKRSIGFALAMDSIEMARAAAKAGVLSAGTRHVTISRNGSTVTTAGTALPSDRNPSGISIGAEAQLHLTREISLEPGTTDLYRVKASVSWNTFGVTTGPEGVQIETLMRNPCD